MTQPAQQQLRQTSFPAMCLVEYALAQLAQAGIEERGLIFTRGPGNVHRVDDWESVLKPVVVSYKGQKVRLFFRGDAVFASPEMYGYLEAEGILYAIRLPKKQIL
jgi:hypothetical protein